MTHIDPRVQRVIEVFERLAPANVDRLTTLYAPDARFKDPFNDVVGVPAIQAVFVHMFETLDEPRFVIRDTVAQDEQCFLTWDFHFRMKRWRRDPQVIHGGSYLRFAADGQITLHRDYWDAAQELYEKLPLIGVLMRWLRGRASR